MKPTESFQYPEVRPRPTDGIFAFASSGQIRVVATPEGTMDQVVSGLHWFNMHRSETQLVPDPPPPPGSPPPFPLTRYCRKLADARRAAFRFAARAGRYARLNMAHVGHLVLTGTCGVGKTEFALQLGRELADRHGALVLAIERINVTFDSLATQPPVNRLAAGRLLVLIRDRSEEIEPAIGDHVLRMAAAARHTLIIHLSDLPPDRWKADSVISTRLVWMGHVEPTDFRPNLRHALHRYLFGTDLPAAWRHGTWFTNPLPLAWMREALLGAHILDSDPETVYRTRLTGRVPQSDGLPKPPYPRDPDDRFDEEDDAEFLEELSRILSK